MINMLRREQKIRNIILFTLFSFLFIGVGYAVISSNLQMNGSMTLNKITWDVHFENFEELYNNTVTGTNSLSNEDTTLTYNVTLNKPGDIYEFTVDIVNNGNIDAMLSSLGNSGLTSAQQEVLDYSVTYLDGSIPTEKDSLKVKEVETLVVSIKTKADITNSKLSATDTNLSLTLSPTYAQDDGTSTNRKETLKSKILSINGGIDAIKAKGETNRQTSETEVVGMYSLPDDYGDSFFYRGKVLDNNIIFDNICWKIIRINGNGTIRIIYNGNQNSGACSSEGETIGKTPYNSDGYDNTFVGYMHSNKAQSNYEDTHKNLYESDLKIYIDKWYENTITKDNQYISDSLFCNDRGVENTNNNNGIGNSQTGFYGSRIHYDFTSPVLTCQNKNDRFTVNDKNIGNGYLKYPIATITGDEIMLAGYKFGESNTSGYMSSEYAYWTMSPVANDPNGEGASVWLISNGIQFGHVKSTYFARPVLNLKQGTKIISGEGTSESPYIVN